MFIASQDYNNHKLTMVDSFLKKKKYGRFSITPKLLNELNCDA